jgi:hypothetical protein
MSAKILLPVFRAAAVSRMTATFSIVFMARPNRCVLPSAPQAQIRLVPALTAEPLKPQAEPSSSSNRLPTQNSAHQRKGWLDSILGGGGPSSLHIASYVFDKSGKFTVTLSNGEIWRQAANDTNYADWREPASDYVVTLINDSSAGAIMDVRGDTGVYIVRRVR